MDLHNHLLAGPNFTGPTGPNPAWGDGEALKIMWTKMLTKELPDDD